MNTIPHSGFLKIGNWKLKIVCAVSLLFLCIPAQTQASIHLGSTNTAALSNGLIAYWPLDVGTINWGNGPTFYDLSGNGNNATSSAMSTTSSPTSGHLGQALQFNGTNNYLIAAHSSSYDATLITVSIWAKTTSLGWLKAIGEGADLTEKFGLYLSPGGLFSIETEISGVQYVNLTSNKHINDNVWHHLVYVYDGNTAYNYVDGHEEARISHPGALTIDGQNISIGAEISTTSQQYWWRGSLDDARVYNRPLTPAEVLQLYNLGKANAGHANTTAVSQGLVGYWPMDGSVTNWTTGTTNDLSGNNTGHLISMATGTTPTIGKIGQALVFNTNTLLTGGSSWINVGNDSSLTDLASTSPATFVMWLKPASTTMVMEKNDNNNTAGWWIAYNTFAGWLDLTLVRSSTNYVARTNLPPANVWTHVAIVYSGGVSLDTVATTTFYFNGALQPITSYQTGAGVHATDAAQSMFFGWNLPHNDGGGGHWLDPYIGTMDDVRIYNRALSAGEIAQLYNTGKTVAGHSNENFMTNGLVGYWPFDGPTIDWTTPGNTFKDISGNGNNATSTGLATSTARVAGKIGQALVFNGASGASQYVGVLDAPVLDPGTTDFSWAFWEKTTQDTGGQWGGIVVKENSSQSPRIGWGSVLSGTSPFNNTIDCEMWFNGTNDSVYSLAPLNDGKWHHITCVRQSGVKLTQYVDGAFSSTTAAINSASNNITNSVLLTIGKRTSGNPASVVWFKGTIDDVRIYNRALSTAEVAQLYNAGR